MNTQNSDSWSTAGGDVNFPRRLEELPPGSNLSEDELLRMRGKYLGYAYDAMATVGRKRGQVLVGDVRIITREMIEASLIHESLIY